MKIRIGIILCALVLGVYPVVGFADAGDELIETYPTGDINWTHGVVIGKGSGLSALGDADASRPPDSEEAYGRAIFNIGITLSRLRIDGKKCVADVMANNATAGNKVAAMVSGAEIIRTEDLGGGKVEVTAQMLFHGGFAQFILPEEIRQVESIRPLNGLGAKPVDGNPVLATVPGALNADEADAFTGLIVDARGIGARPSMVPRLHDESGQEVYSPAFVSREYAVQYGVCQYRRLVGNAMGASRVAPRPLLVKGLSTVVGEPSQVVISNADAAKLRSSSAHLGFLKQCRVIILMD